jgi:hypothetical protein
MATYIDQLSNAINQINDTNLEVIINYFQNNESVGLAFQRRGVITERVRRLVGLHREFNYHNLSREEILVAVAVVGSSIEDGPVIFYHSPVHGIVRIYFQHGEWVFHIY